MFVDLFFSIMQSARMSVMKDETTGITSTLTPELNLTTCM